MKTIIENHLHHQIIKSSNHNKENNCQHLLSKHIPSLATLFEIYTVPCDDVQRMLSFGFSNKNGMEVCSKEGLQVTDYLCKVGIIVLKAIFVLWIIADGLPKQ